MFTFNGFCCPMCRAPLVKGTFEIDGREKQIYPSDYDYMHLTLAAMNGTMGMFPALSALFAAHTASRTSFYDHGVLGHMF